MSTVPIPERAWGAVPQATQHPLSWHLLVGIATGKESADPRRVAERATALYVEAAMPLKDAVLQAMGEHRPPTAEAAA